MKTNVVDVSGMLSPLSARGVEKQLGRLRGIKKVEVNYVAGSATVTYDEAQTDLKTIKAKIEEAGITAAERWCHGTSVRLRTHRPRQRR